MICTSFLHKKWGFRNKIGKICKKRPILLQSRDSVKPPWHWLWGSRRTAGSETERPPLYWPPNLPSSASIIKIALLSNDVSFSSLLQIKGVYPLLKLNPPPDCLSYRPLRLLSNKGKKCLFVCIPGVIGEIESERIDCKFCKTDFKLDWFRRRVPIYHHGILFWTQHDVHIPCISSSSGIGIRGPSWLLPKSVTVTVGLIMKTNNGQVQNHYVSEKEILIAYCTSQSTMKSTKKWSVHHTNMHTYQIHRTMMNDGW